MLLQSVFHPWLDCSLPAVVAGGADPGRRGRIIGKYPACAAGVNAPGYKAVADHYSGAITASAGLANFAASGAFSEKVTFENSITPSGSPSMFSFFQL